MQRSRSRWQSWLDDYVRFMDTDRGLSAGAQSHYSHVAERYLAWQFRRRPVDWRRVRPQDIWRYVRRLRRPGRKAQGLNSELSALRQFLRFVHLRGGSTVTLAEAVPAVSGGPRSLVRPALSAEHRRQLLASFDQHSPEGVRDYAMARCMTDLGLRCVEVARLRLHDLDWPRQLLSVPPAKNGRGRLLPMPTQVATALRRYVNVRPPPDHPYLFVGQRHAPGRPLSPPAIRAAMEKAYRRCGCSWYGTHRLRRGFATRLYAGGANLKEIADLLGHRFVTTTERYAQVDPDGLVALVRPWPL
jgi:integrase/recombinase XerD